MTGTLVMRNHMVYMIEGDIQQPPRLRWVRDRILVSRFFSNFHSDVCETVDVLCHLSLQRWIGAKVTSETHILCDLEMSRF